MIEISINTFETEMLCNLEVCPILVTKLRPFFQSEQAIRGFKHWSNNQKPRTKLSTTVGATPENASFFRCENHYCGKYVNKDDFKHLLDPDYEICPVCNAAYVTAFRDKNPLLTYFPQ